MNKAWGYCRYSMDRPGKKARPGEEANSVTVQKEAIERYYKYALEPKGVIFGGFFVDPAVSADKHMLADREQGGALCRLLTKGDHFIAAKMDRAFRKARDCVTMMDIWKDKGVTMHLLDCSVDTSTDFGRCFLQIAAAFAEMERSRISSRISEGQSINMARLKAAGKPYCSASPLGYRAVGFVGHKYFVPDVDERRQMSQIYEWHLQGFSIHEIWLACCRNRFIRKHRPKGKFREWCPKAIVKAIKAERWYREGYDPLKKPPPQEDVNGSEKPL